MKKGETMPSLEDVEDKLSNIEIAINELTEQLTRIANTLDARLHYIEDKSNNIEIAINELTEQLTRITNILDARLR